MKKIETDKAPQALGPYSQGIEAGGFLFVSGQVPLCPKSGEMKRDIKEATRQSLANIKAILEAGGSNLNKVVKTTIFITKMEDFPLVNEIYAGYFSQHQPARSCVEVSDLPKGALVEIEAIALK